MPFFMGSYIAGKHINLLWVWCSVSSPLMPNDPVALSLVSTGLLMSGSWTSAALVIKEHWAISTLAFHSHLPSFTLFQPLPPSLLYLPVHSQRIVLQVAVVLLLYNYSICRQEKPVTLALQLQMRDFLNWNVFITLISNQGSPLLFLFHQSQWRVAGWPTGREVD